MTWVYIPLLCSILVSILVSVIDFLHPYVSHLELALISNHLLFLLSLLLLDYRVFELVSNLLQSKNVLHTPQSQ